MSIHADSHMLAIIQGNDGITKMLVEEMLANISVVRYGQAPSCVDNEVSPGPLKHFVPPQIRAEYPDRAMKQSFGVGKIFQ